MKRTEIMALFDALNERRIAYLPIYRDIAGSTTAAVLLSQLTYWQARHDGKFFKTDKDIEEETRMTPGEIRGAKKRIEKLPFIEISVEGLPAKTYYKIDRIKLAKYIADFRKNNPENNPENKEEITEKNDEKSTKNTRCESNNQVSLNCTNWIGENEQTGLSKSSKQVCANVTNRFVQNTQTLNKITTEEITEEITEEKEIPLEKNISSKIPIKNSSPPREIFPKELANYLHVNSASENIWEMFQILIEWIHEKNLFVDWSTEDSFKKNRRSAARLFSLVLHHFPDQKPEASLRRFLNSIPEWHISRFSIQLIVSQFESITNQQKNAGQRGPANPEKYKKAANHGRIIFE